MLTGFLILAKMVNDTKKVQTMINLCADGIIEVRSGISKMLSVRAAFQAHNPSVVGTPLEGNVNTLNNALNALNTLVNTTDSAIWNAVIEAVVPTHKNKALE